MVTESTFSINYLMKVHTIINTGLIKDKSSNLFDIQMQKLIMIECLYLKKNILNYEHFQINIQAHFMVYYVL